ncbi:MAG: PAS domain-containing protein, partial [Candidatus Competibacteraceae bacterium]|nr:PAS domain-containing protein [Candidatus Competibacteraceae bacterium]
HPVIYVNPAFERMTGYSAQDMIGQNCRFLQGDDRNQAAIEQVSNALQQHRSVSVELRNYRKDGTLFWNELRVAPIRDES